jgi:hypothetical protein
MVLGSSDYPRDLAGYGRHPPDPRWPGRARIALQFVVNYEEGGERSILHGDPTSEAFLSDVLGAQPWPGQCRVDVRIRLARRLLAALAAVHRAKKAGDGVWRGDRARPSSGGGRGHGRSGLGNRQPRPEMDRLQGFLRGGRTWLSIWFVCSR